MLTELEAIVWDDLPQPDGNQPGAVPTALRALASASAETSQDAYNRLLFAVGNNHAGTYFPVVLAVIPFLGEILADGDVPARTGALNVLIDLLASFEPEPGFETLEARDGGGQLRTVLAERVGVLRPVVERCRDLATSGEEAKLASELIEYIKGSNLKG